MAANKIKLSKKYCVYGLCDPKSGHVFYVGKGVQDRWLAHFKEASTNKSCNKLKIDLINQIQSRGDDVLVEILSEFDYESDAYTYEKYLIEKHANLTNIAGNKNRIREISLFEICSFILNGIGCPRDLMSDLLKLEVKAVLNAHKQLIISFKKLLENHQYVNKVFYLNHG